ncbi:MAG TPA: flagellar basal body-associated FliL family protein [Candidatus Aquilonibacter sp.]|nr:flagellar basal body-associated FliL family protein [Candidatus Aquilonibacter sp.]
MPEEAIAPARASRRESRNSGTVVVMSFLVIVAVGVAAWFYHRSVEEKSTQLEDSPSSVVSVLHLDSFVVNLGGGDGTGYLRIGIDLGLGIELKESSGRSPHVGELRDTILTVLGTRTVDELLTSQGKDKLRADLLQAIQERMPELHCHEVYFTEFLVQH